VQAARQALCDDQGHRRGDVVGRDAHVHQARNGLRRVVGVQGGEHQVAGLRGLDRDLGGFQVADFADHDDVRVLAQEGAQAPRRRSCRLLDVLLHLVDAGQRISTGSSAVEMLRASVLRMFRPVYSDTVLPEPVGPVTSTMP
jgi:hypothetical protein